jgi:hypothetical protein
MNAPKITLGVLFVGACCIAQPNKFFADPQKACGLLASEGFLNLVWQSTAYGYACSSVKPDINYTVSGDHPRRAKRLKLKLLLHSGSSNDTALIAEFDRIATVMLTRIGLKVPGELHTAIGTTRQFRQAQRGANITFDPGRSPFTELVLVIRDPRVRVVTMPRSP